MLALGNQGASHECGTTLLCVRSKFGTDTNPCRETERGSSIVGVNVEVYYYGWFSRKTVVAPLLTTDSHGDAFFPEPPTSGQDYYAPLYKMSSITPKDGKSSGISPLLFRIRSRFANRPHPPRRLLSPRRTRALPVAACAAVTAVVAATLVCRFVATYKVEAHCKAPASLSEPLGIQYDLIFQCLRMLSFLSMGNERRGPACVANIFPPG